MIYFTVLLIVAAFVLPAQSAMKKLGQTGLKFLSIDMTARAAAMGSATLVAGGGAESVFINPAGIAEIPGTVDFFVGQTSWIADITYNSLGLVYKMENIGTFGLSVRYSDYGEIVGAQVAPTTVGYEKTGDVDVGAYSIGLSYARYLSTKFIVGGQVKMIHQSLGESLLNDETTVQNELTNVAFDFGTIFYPGWKSFRFGMSVRNFSEELKYQKESFQIPLSFTIGVAMDVLDLMGEHKDPLLISVDAIHPRDYAERLHLGAEYVLMDMLALRVGYKTNYDVEGLTAGAGFQVDVTGFKLNIDYAYTDVEFFDTVNRFTVGFSF